MNSLELKTCTISGSSGVTVEVIASTNCLATLRRARNVNYVAGQIVSILEFQTAMRPGEQWYLGSAAKEPEPHAFFPGSHSVLVFWGLIRESEAKR